MNSPLNKELVDAICIANGLRNAKELGNTTIRQLVSVVSDIERATGERYVRMEMGVPGLEPSKIGIEAEQRAIQTGIAAKYPAIMGIDELKREASRFIKAFINIDVPDKCIVPTVGSMQGAFTALLACKQMRDDRDTILFLDPGFPVQKQQCQVMEIPYLSFDVADYRDEKLGPKIEEYLRSGKVAAMLFSNPNNPSWMCLNERELRTIGELATKYDVVVIEDLAYLNMDFREDRSVPFQPPFQPTVARYTENYVQLLSASKIFSYAGQRGAIIAISEGLFEREFSGFERRYGNGHFGQSLIHKILYCLSAGVTHTVQYAMTAMFKAASDGEFNYIESVKEYGRRAQRVKEIMLRNGFHIVYDKDCDQEVGDGFFFTFGYKDMTGEMLINKLIYYGISAIPLGGTGSAREGLRGCTSSISEVQYDELDKRLKLFSRDY
ncbi:MAG: pyridoxal phosphate-dependent aminotransferase [Alistipes sp.]|nr:pyridoxal phosphate-dependent aminotransferase [Alistipes sp.]